MLTSSVTSKGQVTIPMEIRQQLNLQPGEKVAFALEDDRVVLFRKEKNIEASFGIYKAKQGVSLKQMEQVIKERGKGDFS
ncbi:MAG: AbrB/MazE/SpoVT family DNA-binding domain-containing protein [Proteobacteria bacterium]|nr:AbrB/MazE/SpoVT family DNA-binding domain-containing protein [Pseudomonadota bacterium]